MKATRDKTGARITPSDKFLLMNGPFTIVGPPEWGGYIIMTRDRIGIDSYTCRDKCQQRANELNDRLALLYMVQGTPAAGMV